VRLLRAELAKLRRPLLVWLLLALAVFVMLTGWSGVSDAAIRYAEIGHAEGVAGPELAPSCPQLGLPEGSRCRAEQQRQRQELEQGLAEFRRQAERAAVMARALQHPLAIGALAAGMVASMPGAVVLLLLCAGHVGNEWSGHTIRAVLTQEGRRWRVLAAKLASLWLAGVGILLVVWAVLALASWWFGRYQLAGAPLRAASAWRLAGPQAARALLVIAAFVVLGVLAAVVTRNTLGSFLLALAFVVGSLVAANFPVATRATLSYWVTGWMGYQVATVPFHFWPASVPPTVPYPSHQAGLYGLLGLLAVGGLLAFVRMVRSDVKA
jgi:hypothetical protein